MPQLDTTLTSAEIEAITYLVPAVSRPLRGVALNFFVSWQRAHLDVEASSDLQFKLVPYHLCYNDSI